MREAGNDHAQANLLGCESVCISCYLLHLHRYLVLLISKADAHFTVSWRVEDQANLRNAINICSSCSCLPDRD